MMSEREMNALADLNEAGIHLESVVRGLGLWTLLSPEMDNWHHARVRLFDLMDRDERV